MSALWAIVEDTWRQSRQQVVFVIMIGLLWLGAAIAVVIAQPVEVQDEDGHVREHVSLMGVEGSHTFLEEGWVAIYSSSLMLRYDDSGERLDPFSEEGQKLQADLLEVANQAARTDPKRRGVEVLLFGVASAVFSVSMMLFIAAASGYFPAMLEAGALDIVLAKPLDRWKVYLGKYLGGLALYTVAIASTYLLIFVGFGVRTGIWCSSLALVLPLQIFAAATLFALLGLAGVFWRSYSLAMILGYVYYIVVDSIVSLVTMLPFQVAWLQSLQKFLRACVPNFDQIKSAATLSVINVPAIDWQPILVAGAWLVLSLGLGYAKFHRTDY
jgi:ABC-type transport system involved in multi-copper enzyme maturation permease subunit